MTGSVSYKISDSCEARLYPAGDYSKIDFDQGSPSKLGELWSVYPYKDSDRKEPSLIIADLEDGNSILRLVETRRYTLKLVKDDSAETDVEIQNEENRLLNISRDEENTSFQFINYLGRSKLTITYNNCEIKIPFEVIPDKMNYEDDYIALTEALAENCSELLLEYSGTTSNLFKQSEEDQKTLLEQFIFLRQFCASQNIQGLFEAIKRNPDRLLEKEEELKPFGTGKLSSKFYTNPFSYSRGWQYTAERKQCLPVMAAVTKKYDNTDTVANRFIRLALQRFDFICSLLIEKLETKEKPIQAECRREAIVLHNLLDDILQDNFFDNIGSLDIMPQNNQILQKREGYSQIFAANSMIDLALQLDWKGKDDVYEGESKNVALLYEYWLFFELFKIIKSIEGCKEVETDEYPFIETDEGITISLKEGKESCQAFVLNDYSVKINLYYNRTFKRSEFRNTQYEGSYSRSFRPDYTLAIFPYTYTEGKHNGEDHALNDGAVSYIHFDAKYRITKLTDLIGKDTDAETDEELLKEDKTDSVVSVYKRGDLLKMHTYNDAIRRTVGSYVLYPGSNNSNQKDGKTFSLYDEILPGVGAFAIKPSIEAEGQNELRNFIIKLIETKTEWSSRLNRVEYYTGMVIKEPTADIETKPEKTQTTKDKCVMGYIRADKPEDYYYFLKDNGYLKNGKEFLFYFYAIKDNNVYSHHKDVFNVPYFCFYKNEIHDTDSYIVEPVICRILSNELISRQQLVGKLQEIGYQTDETRHHADFYFSLKVCVEKESWQKQVLTLNEVNALNGNDTFSPHSPKIIGLLSNS